MVARNFSLQDLSYSRLLEVPDEEREFLNLEELKPHQLTELGISNQCPGDFRLSPRSSSVAQEQNYGDPLLQQDQEHVYYDLNIQHTTEYGIHFECHGLKIEINSRQYIRCSGQSSSMYIIDMDQNVSGADVGNSMCPMANSEQRSRYSSRVKDNSDSPSSTSRKRKTFYST